MKFIRVHGRVVPIREPSQRERNANRVAKATAIGTTAGIGVVGFGGAMRAAGRAQKVASEGAKLIKHGTTLRRLGGIGAAASLLGYLKSSSVRQDEVIKRTGVKPGMKPGDAKYDAASKALGKYGMGDLGAFLAGDLAMTAAAVGVLKNGRKMASAVQGFRDKLRAKNAKVVKPVFPKLKGR